LVPTGETHLRGLFKQAQTSGSSWQASLSLAQELPIIANEKMVRINKNFVFMFSVL
jgi:hypothetical protein